MVDIRKDLLATDQVYHIFNKSIADFRIFNDESEFQRMLGTIRYYRIRKPYTKFSKFIESSSKLIDFSQGIDSSANKEKLVEILAYCLMPTHLHLILKQLKDEGISTFMSNVQNSYARYFNIKHNRKGPLWVGKFRNVLVSTDEQLQHLTRYIHLNPVSAYLVDKPQDWPISSYKEYVSSIDDNSSLCKFRELLDIEPVSYQKFVEDRISYQRELEKIKHLILE